MKKINLLSLRITMVILFAVSFINQVEAQTTRDAGTETAFNTAYSSSATGDIINITGNIVITAEKVLSKTITINGNGFTITVPNPGLDDMGIFTTSPSTFRVFNISGSVTLTINQLTIKGGSVSGGNLDFGCGGAITVASASTLHLNNCIVSNSRVSSYDGGGGISNEGVTYLKNSLVIRNASQYGGGFYNSGTMFVENSTFSENRSTVTNGGGGAGENRSTGTLYFNNSTISNNQSPEIGGGINNKGGIIYMANSSVTGNVAYGVIYGGGIGNNNGYVYAVNTLFAYNYHRTEGDVTNPTAYVLDDILAHYAQNRVYLYYCIYHASLPDLTNNVIGNIKYTGLADGSDNSIFSGGALSRITNANGTEIGTAYVYRPFLYNNNSMVAPTLKSGSFLFSNRGTQTRFANNNNANPTVAYYNISSIAWVDLKNTSSAGQLVTADQVGVTRANPPAVGAIESATDNLYMLKVNTAANGTVNGGTLYGNVYAGGTSVTLTAIPNAGYTFTGWDFVLGGSGSASSDNPYTFTVNSNLTLVPVFTAGSGYNITYMGNGNTGGTAPASAHFTSSTTISNQGTLVKTGYPIFGGWNTSSNGSGTSYAVGSTYSAGVNLSLYANWQTYLPIVSTSEITAQTATSATSGSATSGGNVSSDGYSPVTARGVCWSTTKDPTIANSHTTDGAGTGSYTSSITGLSVTNIYRVRAYATNSVGTSYGSQYTIIYYTPTVTTTAISSVTPTSATSGGNVTNDGNSPVTARGVCWNTTGTPTITDSYTTDGTGMGSYTSSITSLSVGTTYYVRAYATNSSGTKYGSQLGFVASPSLTPALCIPLTSTSTNHCLYEYISGVATTGGVSNFINTSGCEETSYTDYSSLYSVSQSPGGIVNMSFTSIGSYSFNYSVWVDFNNNGEFSTGERVIAYDNSINKYSPVNTSFTVPIGTTAGLYRMRVRGEGSTLPVPSEPCTTFTYGETEDYRMIVVTPVIALSDHSPQVTAASVAGGTTNVVFHQSALAITVANATLTGITCTTAGNYIPVTDISNLKVWYSVSSTFSAGGGATLLSTITPGATGLQTFTSFTPQILNSGSTGYIYITADVAPGATVGNTVNIVAMAPTDFTFLTGTATGSTTAGGVQTLTCTYWFGTLSTNWNTAGNWSTQLVPTSDIHVIIPGTGITNWPVVNEAPSTPAVCNNLTISAGGLLSVAPGKALTVKGILTNNAGNGGLVIQSTDEGTGSLIHSTELVHGTVERYIPAAIWGTWNDGWHFLTSPVADHAITGVFTVTPAEEYDFYAWDEKNNKWINFKNTIAPLFNDADINGSSTFELGKSYMAAYKTTGTKIFSGILNVKDVSVTGLGVSTGINRSWHLIGNPFTSALTWDETADWNKTRIGGVANIWNETGRSYTPLNAGDSIPAGNGFMAQANGGGSGSFTIPAAKRTHSSQAWFKNSDYPVIKMFAYNLDDPSFQESQVRFNPQSTSGFDLEFDSDFLPGYAPLFYSKIDGVPTSVNSMPEFAAETVIPFSFMKNEGTNFSIEATGLESLKQTATIYLHDTKLGINHKLSENPVYTFTSFAGDTPERFELRFETTGIGETPTMPQINAWVYNNMLYVNKPDGNTQIEVFDLSGKRLLYTQLSGNGLQSMPLHQPTGLYLIRLTSNGKTQTIKANVNMN